MVREGSGCWAILRTNDAFFIMASAGIIRATENKFVPTTWRIEQIVGPERGRRLSQPDRPPATAGGSDMNAFAAPGEI
jgi:hypothetical protein